MYTSGADVGKSLTFSELKYLGGSEGNSHQVVWALQNLTGIYRQLDRYNEAFASCRRAIGISLTIKDDVKGLASLHSNMALLHTDCEQYDEGELHCKYAIELLEKNGDTNSESFAAYLDNLALILTRQGRYRDALPHCQRAMLIFKSVLRPDHPKLAAMKKNLSDLRRLS